MKRYLKVLNVHGPGETGHNRNYNELKKYFDDFVIYSPDIDYENNSPNDILAQLMLEGPYDILVGESLGGVFASEIACMLQKEVVLTNIWCFPDKYVVDKIKDYPYLEELKAFTAFFGRHNVFGYVIKTLSDDWYKKEGKFSYVPWSLGAMRYYEPYEGGKDADKTFEELFRECTIGKTMYAGSDLICPNPIVENLDNFMSNDKKKIAYIYGDSGVGKTFITKHFLNTLSEKNPDMICKYISADDLCEEISIAMKDNCLKASKEKYASVDLLVIDNFEVLKTRSDEALDGLDFLTTAMFEADKKIIILCRTNPRGIIYSDSKLMEKIYDGMCVKIGKREETGKTCEIIDFKSWAPQDLKYKDLCVGIDDMSENHIDITWGGHMGFGELSIYKLSDGKWHADTECMASESNKGFLEAVAKKFIEDIIIEE